MKNLGSFSITSQESQAFAQLSGDYNPLHIDPLVARRTPFGRTLIHGVCGTIKALDLFLRQAGRNTTLLTIKVKYNKPVSQGQELTVVAESLAGVTRLELLADGVRCQIISFETTDTLERSLLHDPLPTVRSNVADACAELTIEDCKALSGAVDLVWDRGLSYALFPDAVRYLPERQLATLIASTQIVGMKCPGLHSIFAQLTLHFFPDIKDADASTNTQLEYRTLKTDTRIDQVELGVQNAYAEGTVEAFFRPPPAQQARFAQITTLVSDQEFSNQNALIVGASRGLGEVISKVLAAGGANIMMTYAVGRNDASRICEEIAPLRSVPEVCQYDVLDGTPSDRMIEFCASVTHIYYLASPTIEKGDSKHWNPQLFTRYCNYYIDGLATLLQQIGHWNPGNHEMRLFIPSSIFVEEKTKGFGEYIAAKSKAEDYVQNFAESHPNWRVAAPRLPRLHTDQTSNVKNTDDQKTLTVIIDQLRLAFSNPIPVKPSGRKTGEIQQPPAQ